MTKKTEIKVPKTARIFKWGDTGTPQLQWLAMHGYGQLGLYFIKKFEPLDPQTHEVLVPEGLHRFYLEGFYGRVGASWMTKEDRLTDIADNHNYLDRVLEHMNMTDEEVRNKLVLFGFSQGTATLIRWIEASNIVPRAVVIWAGTLPEEVNFEALQKQLRHTEVIYVLGKKDEFLNDQNYGKNTALLRSLSPDYKMLWFEGNHNIYPGPLRQVGELILRK